MSTKPEHTGLRRRAVLSTRALNAALDAGLSADPAAIVDLRADAYGHGAEAVEQRARARGASRFLRDGDTLRQNTTAGPFLLAPYE